MIRNVIHQINNVGKDFIVSDLHGCLNQLERKLKKMKFNYKKDRLFSVGDLIDRGPNNMECLALINEPWFFPVIGNHEMLMIDGLRSGDNDLWHMNGGSWSIGIPGLKTIADSILTKVPFSRTVKTKHGTIGICHAQPPTSDWNDCAEDNLSDTDLETMIWGRSLIKGYEKDWNCKNIDLTIHGHTIIKDTVRIGNALFIDTGSYVQEQRPDIGYTGVSVIRIDNILKQTENLTK